MAEHKLPVQNKRISQRECGLILIFRKYVIFAIGEVPLRTVEMAS